MFAFPIRVQLLTKRWTDIRIQKVQIRNVYLLLADRIRIKGDDRQGARHSEIGLLSRLFVSLTLPVTDRHATRPGAGLFLFRSVSLGNESSS